MVGRCDIASRSIIYCRFNLVKFLIVKSWMFRSEIEEEKPGLPSVDFKTTKQFSVICFRVITAILVLINQCIVVPVLSYLHVHVFFIKGTMSHCNTSYISFLSTLHLASGDWATFYIRFLYFCISPYASYVLCFRGMSHSAMTDMQVIEQEQPSSSSRSSKFDSYEKKSSKGRSFFDDELDEFSSSSSRYELISKILSCLLSDQVNNLEFEKLL